jgi:hypothetical protein
MSEKLGIDDQINKLSEETATKYLQELEKQAIDPLENKLFSEYEIDQKIGFFSRLSGISISQGF